MKYCKNCEICNIALYVSLKTWIPSITGIITYFKDEINFLDIKISKFCIIIPWIVIQILEIFNIVKFPHNPNLHRLTYTKIAKLWKFRLKFVTSKDALNRGRGLSKFW